MSYFWRIFHWGPLIALTIIALVSSFTILCDLQWWPPSSLGGFINIAVFLTWNALTLINFFNAAFLGPGYVPPQWKPVRIFGLYFVLNYYWCTY